MKASTRLLLTALLLVPAVVMAQSPVSGFTAVGIEKRPTGTFYVAAALEGYGPLELLVDTGSSYLVITEPVLAQLKLTGGVSFSRDLEGLMADGSRRVIPLYRIAGLRLGDSCWIHDVEAAVFPAGSRPILGMNVLSRLSPFTFSADPAQLNLAHCQAPVPVVVPAPVTASGAE